MSSIDPMELFALWMFTHDQADRLMHEAVERGRAHAEPGMSGGPDAFTDGFMAMVADERARLQARLEAGEALEPGPQIDETLDELRFEVGELRGRMDAMQATLDRIAARLDAKPE